MPEEDPLYGALRDQIEGLLTEGRQERRQAGEWEKVEVYWHIGDALVGHFRAHPGAPYGEQTIRNLSKDLQLGLTTLYEILRLRTALTSLYARTKLTWSHYRALLHLPDPEQFRRYEDLVEQWGWTTRQLKQAIEAEADGPADLVPDPGTPLRASFGELLTYRVVADPLEPDGPPALDFGFHQLWVPSGVTAIAKARVGDVITIQPTRGGGTRAVVRDGNPRLWTYVARIPRVVDGDTLAAVVDLGLGHRASPRLRLRGIDAPELYTRRGSAARAFVEQALSRVDFVVITTWLTDSYGRFLADLKYLPEEPDPQRVLESGTYLNRQLLQQGLAERYLG